MEKYSLSPRGAFARLGGVNLSLAILAISLLCGLVGCAGHHPKSSARIIPAEDPSPFITDAPEHAGERTRVVPPSGQ